MNKKNFLLPLVMGLVIVTSETDVNARFHVWFDDPFDTAWVDSLMSSHHRMLDAFDHSALFNGPSKEEQEEIKAARDRLSKITHEVKEDNTSVTLSFKGFENLTKDQVKVVKKEHGWLGTITLPEGRIEFFISPRGFQVTSRIELKKEEKTQDDKTSEDVQSKHLYYSSSSTIQSEYFSSLVDMNTLKAEPIKADSLTLTVQKQKEEVLPLS